MKINFDGYIYGRKICEIINYLKIYKNKRIIIKNYKKTLFSGKKKNKKLIIYHTGYPGGLKKKKFFNEFVKNKKNFLKSIKGMLPKNSFSKRILKRIIII
ncbi:uL13 family ribosomal protein [Candidatus Vidania fulgoroideorum]